MPDSNFNPMVRPCTKCGLQDRYPSGQCRPCTKAACAEQYSKNKSKIKAVQANYRATNQKAIRATKSANQERNKKTSAAWRLENKDKIKAYQADYWDKNKDRLIAESVLYRANNREKNNKTAVDKYKATYDPSKTWAKLNPEKNKANAAAWRAAHPELRIIWEQNRRARKRASGGELSEGISEKLFKLQKGKCACCKLPLGDNYHMDHIMPLALGGPNIDSNIQLLRSVCNLKKNAKHPIDFMQSLGFLL